jgi:hypothetical protein
MSTAPISTEDLAGAIEEIGARIGEIGRRL